MSSPGRCLLFGLLLRAGIMAQPVVVAPCGVANVSVTGAPSADYFEQIDEVLGATRSAGLNAWLPYGMALTNRATQNIEAVAVRWLVTNPKGQVATFSVTSMMFEQPKQQVLPGKSVIAVPAALLGNSPLPRQFQLTPPPGTPAGSAHLAEFQSAQRIQVNLDGVVFASGQFVGPNNGKSYEEFVAETTVPSRVASTILAMKEVGEAIGTVVAWLETNSKPQSADRNAQITARTAKTLLMDYKRGGEALLYEVAQGYEKTPGIRLFR